MIENDVQPEVEEPLETFHIYPMGDGFFVRKEAAAETIIDSTPIKQPRDNHDVVMMLVSSIIMTIFIVFVPNSPISEQIVITHTFRLSDLQSYLLLPVTASRSITVAASGKGHQDATHARGFLTFYNGLFTGQTVAQGTILTGADGVQVVTDQDAFIPAANPPLFGQVSVQAHALLPGIRGNIASYAIDATCCATSVKVINVEAFRGGRDARDYHIVARKDVDNGAAPLTQSLYSQEQKVLRTGLAPDAALIRDTCSSTVTANHRAGEEAASVTIHVSATCSASAYSRRALQDKARQLLHVPGGFVLTRLAVLVVRTTPTSVLVAIQYTMLYDFTERNETK